MSQNRNYFIDFLKAILIIFVILLHYPWENGENNSFLFKFILDFSVPAFMYISGYVSAKSYINKGIDSLEDAYRLDNMIGKVLRYVIPFTVAFLVEWVLFRINGLFTVNVIKYGLLAFIEDWFRGGYGMGSYYFPIMLQFVIIFPLMYFLIKKSGKKGLIAILLLNGLYELLKTAYGMNEGEYRLLFFRYLFVVGAGCYMALYENAKRSVWIGIGEFILGIVFVILFGYTNYVPKVITYWSATSFLTCFYVIPIMNLLVGKFHFKKNLWGINTIGKATFNIFLVQMIYYCVYSERVSHSISNEILTMFATIGICVVSGILFYAIEKKMTSSIERIVIRCFCQQSDEVL